MSDREAVKLLHKEMAGWAIVGIKPSSYPESLAEFHLQRGVDPLGTQRKVVLVCATDLGFWIQDVYDPGKPNERTPKLDTTFPMLVGQIHNYLLENDQWGDLDPNTGEDLPVPSAYLIACEGVQAHGFKAQGSDRTWWLTQAMIDAYPEHLGTHEGRAEVAHLIATEVPSGVFKALGIKT